MRNLTEEEYEINKANRDSKSVEIIKVEVKGSRIKRVIKWFYKLFKI